MLPPLFALLFAAALTPKPAAPARAPRLPPVTAEVSSRGSRLGKKIALTFDACSTHANEYNERVVETLVQTHTPATIFLGGRWTEHNKAHVKYLASLPQFELGNHTWTHAHMTKLSVPQMKAELLKTQAAVYAVTGREPVLWRPPFGEYDNKVVETAAALGIRTIEYDLPSGDPDPHATKDRLIAWVVRKARTGDIIVMHLNHLKFHTAEALPEIIKRLSAKGFQFVTVSQLIADQPASEPKPAIAAIPSVK